MTTSAISSTPGSESAPLELKELVRKIMQGEALPGPSFTVVFELLSKSYTVDFLDIGKDISKGVCDFSVAGGTLGLVIGDLVFAAGLARDFPAVFAFVPVHTGKLEFQLKRTASPVLTVAAFVDNAAMDPFFVIGYGRHSNQGAQGTWLATGVSPSLPKLVEEPGQDPNFAYFALPIVMELVGQKLGIGNVAVMFATKWTPVEFMQQHENLLGAWSAWEMLGGVQVTSDRDMKVIANAKMVTTIPFVTGLTGGGEVPLSDDPTISPNNAVAGSVKLEKRTSDRVGLENLGFSMESRDGGVALIFTPQIYVWLGPIRVDFSGLTLRLGWKDGTPDFGADFFSFLGLALSWDSETIKLRGALAASLTEEDKFAGQLFVGLGIGKFKLSLSAIGGYFKSESGTSSFFLFAVLGISKNNNHLAAVGGPFQLTAIAFGFGLNYEVIIPQIEDLGSFPLVRAATETNFLGPLPDASSVLAKMDSALKPSSGTHWGALGAEMLVFGMIRGFVLFVMQGKEDSGLTDIAVLGMFNLQKRLKSSSSPIIDISIAVKIHVALEAGMLEVRAQILPGSYFITKNNCQVQGGVAFCIWWGPSPHAGDWVFTIGGYHPRYPVPAHYPKESKLSIYWSISSAIQFELEVYLAVTRSAFMVGGKLSFTFKTGPLRAWALFYLDALVSWDPVYFDIEIGISLGGSITIWLFGMRTISVSLGVRLAIWGPSVAGRASFKIIGIKFSFGFGDSKAPGMPPLPFGTFVDSMILPESTATRSVTESVVNVQFESGVLADLTQKETRVADYIVDPFSLEFSIQTQIPVKTATLNGSNLNGSWNKSFGIQPCNVTDAELKSAFQIDIEDWTDKDINDFDFTPSLAPSPLALWDPQGQRAPILSHDEVVPNTLTGFSIKPKPPVQGRKLGPIDVATLIRNRKHFEWATVTILPPYSPSRPSIEEIKQTINSSTIQTKRNRLVAALLRQDLDLDDDLRLTETAATAEKFFLGSPVIAPLGR